MSDKVQQLHQDVSRCRGVGCTIKNECRRYLSYRYDILDFTTSVTNYVQRTDGTCSSMIPRETKQQP